MIHHFKSSNLNQYKARLYRDQAQNRSWASDLIPRRKVLPLQLYLVNQILRSLKSSNLMTSLSPDLRLHLIKKKLPVSTRTMPNQKIKSSYRQKCKQKMRGNRFKQRVKQTRRFRMISRSQNAVFVMFLKKKNLRK